MLLNTVHSELKEIGDQLNDARMELQIRQQGHAFTDVVPKSAETIFGKQWQRALEGHVSPEDIFKFSSKDQFTPIDLMLASVYSDKKHTIKQGKRVTVSVTAGDMSYNGTHIALAVDDHNIIIPVVRQGAACGRYQNTDKVEAAQTKVSAFQKRLDEIHAEINGKKKQEVKEIMERRGTEDEERVTEERQEEQVPFTVHSAGDEGRETKDESKAATQNAQPATHNFKPVIYGTLAVLGIAGIIFLVVKSNSTSVEQKIAA